jgi:hypothetical protein
MNRHLMAFLIAPLVVPGLFASCISILYGGPGWRFWSMTGFFLMEIAVVSYSGALFLGVPAYLALRSLGWTRFWITPVVGFVVALITGIFALPSNYRWNLGVGVCGALVGVALWLIGRPDRP